MGTVKVLIASGGTGGHVIPALALADKLLERGIEVIFATDNRGIVYIKDRPGMITKVIRAGTIRKEPIRLIKDMISMMVGILQSFDLMRDYHPDVVIGFGGYPCFPPVFTAQILGIPSMLHEQNAVMGKANRCLAKMCMRVALSFPNFTGLDDRLKARTVVTGRPVSAGIDALWDHAYTPPEENGPFHLLILGGSQGTAVLSTFIPHVLAELPASYRARLHVVHQILQKDLDSVRTLYDQSGITAVTGPFIENIPDHLAKSHLFMGRSGAMVTEICVAGLPAIYIPYPHHKDQQQLKNAQVQGQAGGAIIIDERTITKEEIASAIMDLMDNPQKLAAMAKGAKSCGYPYAAQKLADEVINLVQQKK